MIDGYNGLSSNISQTLRLINDVSSASKEQQIGIEQINDAVNVLDKQTQQNASVASNAQNIAQHTSTIAKKIVKNANDKEFDGKDSVTADTLNFKTEVQHTTRQKVEQPQSTTKKNRQSQTNNSDNDWDSF